MKKYMIIDEQSPYFGKIYEGEEIDNPDTMVDLVFNNIQYLTVLKTQVEEIETE